MSFITAIVVAFDSAHALPSCLDALKQVGVPSIVVDNASRDDSVDVAPAFGATVVRHAFNEAMVERTTLERGPLSASFSSS